MVVVPILMDILHPDVSISRNVVMTMVTMLRYIIPFCTYTYYTHHLRIQHSNTTGTTPGSHCYRGVSKVNWFALPELPYWLPMAFLYHWGVSGEGQAGRAIGQGPLEFVHGLFLAISAMSEVSRNKFLVSTWLVKMVYQINT